MPQTFYTKEEYNLEKDKKRKLEYFIKNILRYHSDIDSSKRTKYLNSIKNYDGNDDNDLDVSRYAFEPNNVDEVLTRLMFISKTLNRRKNGHFKRYEFLDAGCGIGWVVLLAHTLGFNAKGIELNQGNVNTARNLFGLDENVIKGNILTKNYKEYDVIYYYVPIQNHKLEAKFEQKVQDEMKVGSILYACGKVNDMSLDKRFKLLDDKYHNIWHKVKKE